MLSAPAHIPAITPNSFGTGLAAPDVIRGVVIDTFSARICGSRVCSASPSSGTSPACDTRLSSSNRAEPAVNLCDTRTRSALLSRVDLCLGTPIVPAQGALPSFTRRSPAPFVHGSRLSLAAVSVRAGEHVVVTGGQHERHPVGGQPAAEAGVLAVDLVRGDPPAQHPGGA